MNGIVTEEQKERIKLSHDYLRERWDQLNGLVNDHAVRVISLIFLINSGGAVAVLSFMGASKEVLHNSHVHKSLFSFLLGIVMVVILRIHLLHKVDGIFYHWRRDIQELTLGKKSLENLLADDNKRSWGNKLAYFLGYVAFFLFLFGIYQGNEALSFSLS